MANDVKIRISADDKTKRAFTSVQNNLRGVTRGIGSMTAGIGALVGIGGMGLLIKSTLDAGDKIQKLSIRIGASTEALSQYRHVAELSGVSFETLTLGWQRMTRRVAEAAQGTGEAKGALIELGVSASDLARMRPERQFEILADALAGVRNEGDRVRLAMKLFDTEGVSLLQTMTKGSAGIRAMREEADELGLTLTQQQADSMAKFNDSLTRIKNSVTGLATQNLPTLLNWLSNVADYVKNTAIPAFTFLAERIGLVKANINELTENETLARMGLLTEKMQAAQAVIARQARDNPNNAVNPAKIAELKIYAAEYAKLREHLDAINRPASAGGAGGVGAGAPGGAGGGAPLNIFTGLTDQQMDDQLQAAIDAEDALADAYEADAQRRAAAEQQLSSLVMNSRLNVANQGVALLQVFAGKSRAAAIAAIALSKGVQIAQTIMSTQTAAMQARTALIQPGNPASIAAAEAAARAIEAAGAVSVALIAATGLGQASQVGSSGGSGGGAAAGTPANPISTAPQNNPAPFPYGGQTTININADVDFESLIVRYRDRIYNLVLEAQHEAGRAIA